MKKYYFYFYLIFILISLTCEAQTDTINRAKPEWHRHSISIQINPYLKSHYIKTEKFPYVFALRYGYQLKNNLRFGPEFSLWSANIPYYKSNIYKFGTYGRYSFLRKLNFQPFIEANGFYYYENTLQSSAWQSYEKKGGGIDYFLAPGFTLYFLKKHISIDLMCKWNHRYADMSLGPFEFSYRLGYHFNQIKFK